MRNPRPILLAWLLGLGLVAPNTARAGLPDTDPASLGLDPARLARIDDAVRGAIARDEVPGAVALVGRHGRVAHVVVAGQRAVVPGFEAMTRDTAFDLASLTKPVATAGSALKLVEAGKLDLAAPVAQYWPEFGNHGKERITVDQLFRHRSGLIADNAIADYADGPDRAWERIANLGLVGEPGAKFLYSDVNFLVLGKLVERIARVPLDEFARREVFGPMGVALTYKPTDPSRIAPTEPDAGTMLRGVVHDPRARALGGVAGHAGLFGTADDLAVVASTWLNEGVAPNGTRIFTAQIVRQALDPATTPPGERRGLGWDVGTGFSTLRGEKFGPRSFGHTGFTGTSLWADPDSGVFAILLTSRLHPDGRGKSPSRLRAEVSTLAAGAIVGPAPTARVGAGAGAGAEPAGVLCGVDVLARDGFAPLKGKRVGLITNHTGRTRSGQATIDLLAHAPEVKLVALFSPEHGIRGLVDAEVNDARDEATGLPIFSLYGKTRKPTPASLAEVDALVYDIQDVGARFYTYISTLGLALEAAKERGIPLVVLDRPNPIGGVAVAGPVRDDGFESFIAFHAIPVRHGLTVGELARLFNAERKVGADLNVIPCEGWRRDHLFDRTGLVWVNPSPNMRSLTEALVYPGICLLELSNLATGRGTDTPFERFGAPWIDPAAFAQVLNAEGLMGVRFVPIRFSPKERQYAGQDCGGVQLLITDWATFEPVRTGVAVALALHRLYPNQWQQAGFDKMLADRATSEAVRQGRSLAEIEAHWQDELGAFRGVRSQYLLYPNRP